MDPLKRKPSRKLKLVEVKTFADLNRLSLKDLDRFFANTTNGQLGRLVAWIGEIVHKNTPENDELHLYCGILAEAARRLGEADVEV